MIAAGNECLKALEKLPKSGYSRRGQRAMSNEMRKTGRRKKKP
jgi:hypothetical protein